MQDTIRKLFSALRSTAPFWSLRFVEETREHLAVRQDTIEPPRLAIDRGAMLVAIAEGGYGYCATSDLSVAGLQAALDRATAWAEATRSDERLTAIDPATCPRRAASARAAGRRNRRCRAASSTISLADECRHGAHRRTHRRALRGARAAARSSSSISRTPAATCASSFALHRALRARRPRTRARRRRRAASLDAQQGGLEQLAGSGFVGCRRNGSRTRRCSCCSRRTARRAAWICCSCPTR